MPGTATNKPAPLTLSFSPQARLGELNINVGASASGCGGEGTLNGRSERYALRSLSQGRGTG